MQPKRDTNDVLTFDQAAERYIASQTNGWKNGKHAAQWTSTLATYASPISGSLPVNTIDTALVMRVLEPIWTQKTDTASRVRGRMEKVLDWCKVQSYRQGDNPAAWRGHLDHLLSAPKKTATVEHHPALPWRLMVGFMEDLRGKKGMAALALETIILTNCRTSEAIEATWSEFDLAQALWTIPAARMKAAKEHVIPLSGPAVDVLRRAQQEGEGEIYVFPTARARSAKEPGEKPLSNMACLQLLKRMGRPDLTVHGFRSSFRDWAGEATAHPREVIEHAMSHQLKDRAEAAYARGTMLDRRRNLMNDWAAFCSRHALAVADVVPRRERATFAPFFIRPMTMLDYEEADFRRWWT